ncbi:extracellular calcium-sensing receptor [Nematostella vectensis]|uniref:extracellular calcium-sensing receptor n=1 Tax=Nematostella vectensis TaxID=45351 RepID=UPI0013906946|nr:extracellular calcium-sensing receptor [Nematostella vectensis]XP_048587894.1 extracellular calcium-sensing receptor [Nematostella vectensis]
MGKLQSPLKLSRLGLVIFLAIAVTSTRSYRAHFSHANHAPNYYRLYQPGDIIIGGLARLHRENLSNPCASFYTPGLGRVQAMIYAVNKINADPHILPPNVTLGLDIRDFCQDPIKAARHAYIFALASNLNCACVKCTPDQRCTCITYGTCEASMNESVSYPIAAIVGALTSRAALPLANFLQAVRIPLVDASATSEELSSPLYKTFFRTIPPDVNQAKAVADIIDLYQWRYVAAVAVEDSYGRHGVRALDRESQERGTFCIEVLGFIHISNYAWRLRSIVSVLKNRSSIKVIIVWSHAFQGRDLLIEAARQGLTGRVWIFSEAFAMVKPEFLPSNAGIETTGIHLGVQLPRISSLAGYRDFLEAKLKQDRSTAHPWWHEFWDHMTNEYCSTAANMRECSNNISADILIESMMDEFVPYVIDTVYAVAHALNSMHQCKASDSDHVPHGKGCPEVDPVVKPFEVAQYLRHVSFEGSTGHVTLDENGDPKHAFYDIGYFDFRLSNTSVTLKKVLVGSWDKKRNDKIYMNTSSISWQKLHNSKDEVAEGLRKDALGRDIPPSSECVAECKPGEWKAVTNHCCWKCFKCPDGSISVTYGVTNCTECTVTQASNSQRTLCIDLQVLNIQWTNFSAVALQVLIAVGLGLVIVTCYHFIRHRMSPIVKASNKIYSFVLLLGIALGFAVALLYIFVPSDTLCSILKPVRFVIYTLVCSALFLKTMQIVHAFNVSRIKNWIGVFICSTKRQVLALLAVLSIQVLLAAVWIVFDPPYVHRTIAPKSHVLYTCKPYKHVIGQVLENLMLAYVLSMAALCTYYAFRARNLPANFNEAKYISFSLYIFLLSWIVYQPIDYALEGWYVAVLSAATILLSSYGLLGCVFAPKIFIIVFRPNKNTAEFVRTELRNKSCNHSSHYSGSPV